MALHLGILQMDNVLPEFSTQYGDYPDMFHRVFSAADPTVTYTDYDVRVALPASVDCDAYVITGSRNSVYEDLPWIPPLVDFLARVLADGKKIVGVCFGHQLIAHYFGGRVEAAAQGWGVGVHSVDVIRQEWWMQPPADSLSLLCSHKDQVVQLPDDAQLFLRSEFCPMAGYTIGDQVITVQGHPEFRKPYSRALMTKRQEMLGAAVYDAGMASLERETDEQNFVRWILSFVTGQ